MYSYDPTHYQPAAINIPQSKQAAVAKGVWNWTDKQSPESTLY